MAIQYQPLPQFQMPNLNLMGAYAQGQAMAANQALMQEREADLAAKQRAAQNQAFITDLARRGIDIASPEGQRAALDAGVDLPSALTYGKAAQDFSAGTQAAKTAKFDYEQKFRDYAMKRLLTVPEGDDKNYQDTLTEFKDYFPSEYEYLRKLPWNADTRRQLFSTAEQQLGQTVVVANAPGGKERRAYSTFNPLAGEKVIPGSFSPTQEKWTPVRGEKQQIEYYTNADGTKILTPDQYKAMATTEAPAARGQAGAFEAPAVAPPALTPPAAEPMNLINQAKRGVARVESGGNYGAIGPAVKRKDGVDHAYGKYQVMGRNIPSWTKQALGRSLTPQEFLDDQDAQEAVFEDQFKRNIAKYGSLEDAVSVWFSGRPLAQATKAGARDVNIGVQDYVGKVMGGAVGPYQTAKTVPLTGERPSLRALPAEPINALAPPVAPVNAFAAPAPAMPAMQPPAALPPVPSMAVAPPEDIATRQQKFIASAPLGQSNKYKSKVELENMLTNFANEMEYLAEQGGAPSVKNTAAKNAEISAGSSWLGQVYGRFTGSPVQSTRDTIDSIRQNLVSVLARATGKTAQELNSNFDVKNAIKALGDPKATVESVRATLNNINKTFGTNVDITGQSAKSESRRQIEAAKSAPAEAAGVPPEAIQMLRQDPNTAAAFDEHFGVPGLAAKILGQ